MSTKMNASSSSVHPTDKEETRIEMKDVSVRSGGETSGDVKQIMEFRDVSFAIKGSKSFLTSTKDAPRKRILKEVSGRVCSGEVLAVIGPSGAGKTTLIEAVCFHPRVENDSNIVVTGERLLNGKPISRDSFTRSCAYMSQNEALFPSLVSPARISPLHHSIK